MSAAETLLAVVHAAQHSPRHAAVVAHAAVSRVPVIAAFAALTFIALGVVATEAHAGLPVAHAEFHVTVPVAVALAAAQRRRRVTVAARLALLAVASGRPVLTLVADARSLTKGYTLLLKRMIREVSRSSRISSRQIGNYLKKQTENQAKNRKVKKLKCACI